MKVLNEDIKFMILKKSRFFRDKIKKVISLIVAVLKMLLMKTKRNCSTAIIEESRVHSR